MPTITVTAPAADGQGATAVLAGGTVAAGAAEGTVFEVAGSGLARLATTAAGQALLRAAGVVVAPELVAAGTAIYLGYKGVQFLIDQGVLPPLPGLSAAPPMPTSPPPLVPPQVDNRPEAFVTPPVPGQAGDEALQPARPVDKPGEGGLTVAPPISNISQATVADVLAGSVPDSDKPILKDGTLQQIKPGGMPDADADFDSLHPSNIQNTGGEVRVGTLADGTQVVVRPKSVPSLEINPPSGPSYVIRYK